jgi:monofunctional glycosyltransferase
MKTAGFVLRKRVLIVLTACIFIVIYLIRIVLETWSLIPQVKELQSDSFIQEKLKLESWISLGHISDQAVAAIVVSEDTRFFSHSGYDVKSIKNAIKKNLSQFKYKKGASTISQQVIKNVFLNREKTLRRKMEELILAYRMEEFFGKDRIMEIYLNTAQFGPKLYGIHQGSAFYFNKPASELTAKEGAFLAMLLPSPVRYRKSFTDKRLTRYAKKTIASILGRMADEGYLSSSELEGELPVQFTFENISASRPVTSTVTP